MRAIALTAIALAIACGQASASHLDNVEAWYQHARSVIGPVASTEDLFDQRAVLAPPATIDPDMALTPPDEHSRLRIIKPPGTLDDGLQPK